MCSSPGRLVMGFFNKGPKTKQCPLCGEDVLDDRSLKQEHLSTHMFQVTDDNGLDAYTFRCPRHGVGDLAWGGGCDEETARVRTRSGILVHCMQQHGTGMPTDWV